MITPDRESLEEQLSRVAQMSQDDGETWDLSDNDKVALTSVVNILKMLGYYAGHTGACSMQHQWYCPAFCTVPKKEQP
jgi:hypothetical protein